MAETFDFDLVGKVGSMALIRAEDQDIDYNIIARLGAQLKPGMVWVTSGAAEIGRVDYLKRSGQELSGDPNDAKTDYAAQGQSILMAEYRRFVNPAYSVRQVLVEHRHFNEPEKREHIRRLLLRAREQRAIPIINYNDPVCDEENRKWELAALRQHGAQVYECVDNDETAAVVAGLVRARVLLLLTSTDGIYRDADDPTTLVRRVMGRDTQDLLQNIRTLQKSCVGASRPWANGAYAKLEYAIGPVSRGSTVIIGHARSRIDELLSGEAPSTRIGL
ncbi:MAG: uridylate kinase [Oscillospiraceae bacterium]|jgi:glutamate 5-kinase|nr:uridylate kinase [Oscillospiraceae bacterium]